MQVDKDKVQSIQDIAVPTTATQVHRFLGSGGFYHRYIQGFSQISAPLSRLTGKDKQFGKQFQWSKDCQASFNEIKRQLFKAPILKEPDWTCEFHLHTDASLIAVGAVLAQQGTKEIDLPIYYASRLLNVHEQNYTTTEREALAMIFAVKKFRPYQLGNRFVFYVDHTALVNLVNKPQLSGQIAWWILLLAEFDYSVVYKLGRTHVVPDMLSGPEKGVAEGQIEDTLPDSNLYEGSGATPTATDQEEGSEGQGKVRENLVELDNRNELVRFLRTAEYPQDLTSKERRVYAHKARAYTLINHDLYYKGADEVLRRVLPEEEQGPALGVAHDGFGGGHFGTEVTIRKVLQRGLWWKSLYREAHKYVRTCDVCQRTGPMKE